MTGGVPPDVAARWGQMVVEPFQALQGKYPFGGGPDASLAAFSDFFKPGGIFWGFYETSLRRYVSEDGTPAPGAEGMISPTLAEAIRKAKEIREALFVGGAGPTVRFRIRAALPEASPPAAAQFNWSELEFDGGDNYIHYTPGVAQWKEMRWPGSDPGQGGVVRVNAGGDPKEIRVQAGSWTLFRLLDKARQLQSGETSAKASFRIASGGANWTVPFEIEPESGSGRHPFRKNFFRFVLPSSI